MEKDFLQSELKRVCEWIQFSDRKTGFLAIFYSAAIGYLVSNKEVLLSSLTDSANISFLDVLIVAALLTVFYGLYHMFFSAFPSLKNNSSLSSLFYYGHVSSLTLSEYENKMSSASTEIINKHLLEQIHTNSKIANKKMLHVKKASQALFILAGLLLILTMAI